jgi:hypothetical protein
VVRGQLLALAALPQQGKSPWHPLDRRVYGPQSRSQQYGTENLLSLSGIKPLTFSRGGGGLNVPFCLFVPQPMTFTRRALELMFICKEARTVHFCGGLKAMTHTVETNPRRVPRNLHLRNTPSASLRAAGLLNYRILRTGNNILKHGRTVA